MALLFHGVQVELEFRVLVFLEGGKPEGSEKNPWSKDENQQQTQPTCDTRSGNRTQATVLGGSHSHHCAIYVPTNQSNAIIVPKAFFGVFDPITLTLYVFPNESYCFFWFSFVLFASQVASKVGKLVKDLKDEQEVCGVSLTWPVYDV